MSLRGIDNATYYRLAPGQPSRYEDFTGTGNTLNMQSPQVLQLMMDSLRYWVEEMHVDGFRFDLAAALARELHAVDRLSSFFDVIQQDPVISHVKLIAEPWDVGDGGYQVGNFPPGWAEWNGKYRDAVRRFWRGDNGALPELATRLAGSSDLYGPSGRQPHASINFVTAHDGFTLADLVSYNDKHNDANGENNRDGEPNNLSWNCGVEGPTTDVAVLELRARQRRNFLLTMLVSQGVPMLSGGDELGRTSGRQQQRLLPRQRALLDALGSGARHARVPGVRAPGHRAARVAAGPQAPDVPQRSSPRRVRCAVAPARGRRDDRAPSGATRRDARSACCSTATRFSNATHAAGASSATRCSSSSTPALPTCRSPCRFSRTSRGGARSTR